MGKTKIKEALKAIKQIPKDKLADIKLQMEAQSSMKVVSMIMEEEGWTYEQTMDACMAEDERRVPKYALYWKLAQPEIALSLTSKKKKLAFAETLPDDEKEIFLAEMDSINVRKAERKAIGDALKGRKK